LIHGRVILNTPQIVVREIRNSSVVEKVYRLSRNHSVEIFLVGGTVRDLLLGTFSGQDFDFAIRSDPLSFAKTVAQELQGSLVRLHEEFGQYRIVTIENGETVTIDLSRYKGENIEDDLRRRDFTINSMAMSLHAVFENGNLTLVDPLGGLKDLDRKRIKLSSPSALSEDPVRIMRGIRIARQYQFAIDPALSVAMKEERNLLAKAAPERIRTELFKIFDAPGIYESLTLLDELGILEVLLPEVNTFREYLQGNHHRYDLWEHSLKTARKVEVILGDIDQIWPAYSPFLKTYFSGSIEGEVKRSALLKFTAFLHDVGKPLTRTVDEGKIRFFEHEHEGEKINREVVKRFKLGKKAQKYVEMVTKNHMRILNLTSALRLTQRAKYRFFRDLADTGVDILLLSLADAWATGKEIEGTEEYGRIASRVDSFMEYYFCEFKKQPVKPLLSGSDIMEIFSLTEGKRVGELLEMVREAETRGEICTREEAITFLQGRIL
jgi:poly(A) polymerase